MAEIKSNLDRHGRNWPCISTRVPRSEYEKLIQRYPERGKVAKVIRALIQMHLTGEIKNLKFQITEE